MKVARSIDKLRDPSAIRSWTRTILLHQVRDGWRRRGVSIDAQGPAPDDLATLEADPHDRLEAKEMEAFLEEKGPFSHAASG